MNGVGEFSLNTWQHFALVRHGSLISVYIDGKFIYSVVNTFYFTDGRLIIGRLLYDGTNKFNGFIDDFRLTKASRYSNNFNPIGPLMSPPVWINITIPMLKQWKPFDTGKLNVSYEDSFVQTNGVDLSTLGLTLNKNVGYCEIVGTPTIYTSTSITITAINKYGSTSNKFPIVVDAAVPIWETKTLTKPIITYPYDSDKIICDYAEKIGEVLSDYRPSSLNGIYVYPPTGGWWYSTPLKNLGLTLSSNYGYCEIVGTPIAYGTYYTMLRATNGPKWIDHLYTINIDSAKPIWNTTTINNPIQYNYYDSGNITVNNGAWYEIPNWYQFCWWSRQCPLSLYNLTLVGYKGYCKIVGTPTTTGSFDLILRAHNIAGVYTDQKFSIVVDFTPPIWVTSIAPKPIQYNPYDSGHLVAKHGLKFIQSGGNQLSTYGLTLSSNNGYCFISGSYVSTSGANSITLSAINGTKKSDQIFDLSIDDILPVWKSTLIPDMVKNTLYNSGKMVVKYANTFSQLSGDITLSTVGMTIISNFEYFNIVGTPTTSGTFNITLRATNGSATADQLFTLNIIESSIDPFWNNVAALLLMYNGCVDYSGNQTEIINTNVTFDNSVVKFGSTSAHFNGNAHLQGINSNITAMSTDFTIDMWIYPTDYSKPNFIFDSRTYETSYYGICVYLQQNTGNLVVICYGNSIPSLPNLISNISPPLNEWSHIAIVKKGNAYVYSLLYAYINGKYTGYGYTVFDYTDNNFYVGCSFAKKYFFSGYMSNFRITKGYARYAYRVNGITVPNSEFSTLPENAGDPFWNHTALLLEFENDFTDKSNNNVVSLGSSATIDNTIYKVGSSSAYFNGSSNLFFFSNYNIDLRPLRSFTIEMWVYPLSSGGSGGNVIYTNNTVGQSLFLAIKQNPTDDLCSFYIAIYNISNPVMISPSTNLLNKWHHIAVVKSGLDMMLYVDGIVCKHIFHNYWSSTDGNLMLGSNNAKNNFNGYIDHFRFTRASRYTANFVPSIDFYPTSLTNYDPFKNNVKCLVHFDNDYSDEIENLKLVSLYTANDKPYINSLLSNTKSKFGNSLALTGTQYLHSPANGVSQFYSGFTIECYVYSTNTNYNNWHCIVSGRSWRSQGVWFGIDITTGCLAMYWDGGGKYTDPNVFPVNTWCHVALVRNNGWILMYRDGIIVNSSLFDQSFGDWTDFSVGGERVSAAGQGEHPFIGYIDELRITDVARYSVKFTPPDQPFN